MANIRGCNNCRYWNKITVIKILDSLDRIIAYLSNEINQNVEDAVVKIWEIKRSINSYFSECIFLYNVFLKKLNSFMGLDAEKKKKQKPEEYPKRCSIQ